MTMNRKDFEEVCLDVLGEFLPKTVTKTIRKEIAAELGRELEENGTLEPEESDISRGLPDDVSNLFDSYENDD